MKAFAIERFQRLMADEWATVVESGNAQGLKCDAYLDFGDLALTIDAVY
jgi:hypothetical protein